MSEYLFSLKKFFSKRIIYFLDKMELKRLVTPFFTYLSKCVLDFFFKYTILQQNKKNTYFNIDFSYFPLLKIIHIYKFK